MWRRHPATAALALLLLLALPFSAPAGDDSLAGQVARLREAYRAELELTPESGRPALMLGAAARTWLAAARHFHSQVQAPHVAAYLEQTEADYQRAMAGPDRDRAALPAALNLFYQSANTTAYLLAKARNDPTALEEIKRTEQRVVRIAGQPDQEGPALAALSGGVLAMLGLTACLLAADSDWAEVADQELTRRREVDANIVELKDVSPERRIMLMANNHLFGAFSMLQIIGLSQNASLKPALGALEAELAKCGDQDLDEQMTAAARAVVEAGFLSVPPLQLVPLAPPVPTGHP